MKTAQVLEALGKLGISRENLLAALSGGRNHPSLPTRQARRGEKPCRTWKSTVTSSSPRMIPSAYYGKAPVVLSSNNLPDGRATHRARLEALEKAMPGITSVAYVFSIGKDAQGKLCKNFPQMVNTPFTYIELPQGKNQTVGNLSPDEVRRRIKAAGYGFTKQQDGSGNLCCYWGTDSHGNPCRRQFGRYRKLNAAAVFVSESGGE